MQLWMELDAAIMLHGLSAETRLHLSDLPQWRRHGALRWILRADQPRGVRGPPAAVCVRIESGRHLWHAPPAQLQVRSELHTT